MMNPRRTFLSAAGAFAAAGIAGAARAQATGKEAASPTACMVYDKDRQKKVSPDEALNLLKAGNERFVTGKSINCDLMAQVKATADGQAPFATIIGCMDSRAAPELVFDQRIGDIFGARIAGNFVNTDMIGSMEFATKLAGSKLIVVLGHSECGAVKGAVDDAKLGNLTATLANIRPAVAKVSMIDGPRNSKNKRLVQAVADQNARDAAKMLTDRSEVLRELVAAGELKIVSAMHDLHTGRVAFFS